ncbi:TPA: phenylalanine--tRNA ligase subunit alpha [Candidatus Pacearchaeota archaeon]|jgi:phenylalanyl-tRNA synthetase alpha chain|nr:phenylalanine--tRNA ligase subunit alpha [Candidatus Pacearchaeota archaeon]
MQQIINSLSPIERKIIPYLNLSLKEIKEKSKLDKTTILRALQFLEKKKILKIIQKRKRIIELGTNGIYYKKLNLPERRLLILLEKKNHLPLMDAKKESKLTDNEFKVSLGILKKKALIKLSNGKLSVMAHKEEIVKKFLEEKLLESLPKEEEKLEPEEKLAFENLQKRKDIIKVEEEKKIRFELTDLGKKLAGKEIKIDLLEEVTSEMIKSGTKNKSFRKYNVNDHVSAINGGRKHFVNQSIEYVKEIWKDLGFKEMTGNMVETSFWDFDALFQPQDHPARDMQDTFYLKNKKENILQKKELIEAVKKSHEEGVAGSKGWKYKWSEEESKKLLLRTHTTNLSARTLASLKKEQIPAKFFAVGKVFRNETIDWSHGTEFYQTEGIVIDPKVTFRHLLGYLKEFYKKMGFEKIRFRPGYFPYTEPSVEIDIFHPERKKWLELGGAGIFRPEVTVPLLGKNIPVLAWGQGLDRIITDYYKIKDLREMYSNDLKELRERRVWIK